MNVRAVVNTVKVLGLCTLASIAVSAFFTLASPEFIGATFMVAAIAMAVNLCYTNEKNKLEALDRLNNIK